jgi:hypothetical protein
MCSAVSFVKAVFPNSSNICSDASALQILELLGNTALTKLTALQLLELLGNTALTKLSMNVHVGKE